MISNSIKLFKAYYHSLGLILSLLNFYLFYGIAAVLYPGGTWEKESTIGYSFWENYLCDVLGETSLNGIPNPGSSYGLISFGFIFGALVFGWTMLAKFLDAYSPKLAKILLLSSAISCMGFMGIILLPPGDMLLNYHFMAVFFAVFFGIIATFVPVIYFLRIDSYRFLGQVGLLLTTPSAIALCSYVAYHLEVPIFYNDNLIIGMQKISVITTSGLFLLVSLKDVQNSVQRNTWDQ